MVECKSPKVGACPTLVSSVWGKWRWYDVTVRDGLLLRAAVFGFTAVPIATLPNPRSRTASENDAFIAQAIWTVHGNRKRIHGFMGFNLILTAGRLPWLIYGHALTLLALSGDPCAFVALSKASGAS